MMDYKSMVTTMETNLKKLSDSALDSYLIDPIICRKTNLKKLSDSASNSDLIDPTMMTNLKKLNDFASDSNLVGS